MQSEHQPHRRTWGLPDQDLRESVVNKQIFPAVQHVVSQVVSHCRCTAGSPLEQRCRKALRLCSSHTTFATKGTMPQKTTIMAKLPRSLMRWGCLPSSNQLKSSTSTNAKRFRAWKWNALVLVHCEWEGTGHAQHPASSQETAGDLQEEGT